MFVYNFFLLQTFLHQQYEAIPKQNDHFQTHCAWDRATRGTRSILIKFLRVIFLFPQKCISDAILWEKKDNSNLCNVYKQKAHDNIYK